MLGRNEYIVLHELYRISRLSCIKKTNVGAFKFLFTLSLRTLSREEKNWSNRNCFHEYFDELSLSPSNLWHDLGKNDRTLMNLRNLFFSRISIRIPTVIPSLFPPYNFRFTRSRPLQVVEVCRDRSIPRFHHLEIRDQTVWRRAFVTGRKWPEFNCGGKLWQVSEFSRIDRCSLLRGGKGGRGGGIVCA